MMELRQLIVAEILGEFGDGDRAREKAWDAANSILAIPEIAEALQLVRAIDSAPEGVVLTGARPFIDDSPPKASPTHP